MLSNRTEQILKTKWSGRGDLNSRPLGPEPSALPSCATPRLFSNLRDLKEIVKEGLVVSLYQF